MKKIIYSLAVAVLAAPALVSAQFDRAKTNAGASDLPSRPIYDLIENIMLYLLAIIGFLSIIGFVIAGIMFLTAAGSEDQIKRAKSALKYSIIGIIVALVGYVVFNAVGNFLGGSTSF